MHVKHDDDGFTAEVPSIKGCESWAHNEDDAIKGVLEMVGFYLKLTDEIKITIDKAAKKKNVSIYKLLIARAV
jgi:predicted RNase H-like HicB family nuclease